MKINVNMIEKLRILHLEDNRNDAELVGIILKKFHIPIEYTLVDNEAEFLKNLSPENFDLILSDYSLPDYDGILALEAASKECPDIPFIFVSGTLGEDVAVESLKKGATDYVLKSRLTRLTATIERAIEEKAEKKKRINAENRFKKLIESARDIIFTVTRGGIITSLNNAFEKLTGWDREMWIGRGLIGLVHPDDLNKTQNLMLSAFKNENIEVFETRLLNYAGSYITVESLVTPVNDGGNISELLSILRDVTERKKSEQVVKQSLREKEILLKEVHHRVKNNLQIISGLLKMQLENIDDPRVIRVINEIQSRVMSMALIHQSFIQSSNFSEVDFKFYTEKLVNNLVNVYTVNSKNINIDLNVEKYTLGIDIAIPCGLIINEIVSNSLQHAFNNSEGKISLSFKKTGDTFILHIKDNGKGLARDFDIEKCTTIGMVIIRVLVMQIDGVLNINSENGTEYLIEFPPANYKNRLKDISK